MEKTSKKLRSVFIMSILTCWSLILHAAKIPDQPLTMSLPAKLGKRTITADWLLSLPKNNFEFPIIRWLDDSHLIYSLPPMGDKKAWKIETLNVLTGKHEILGEGSVPKPSPDGKWIAFTRGEDQTKQLWIMRNTGTDAKQLSHIQGGLRYYQASYDFAWSPNSKQIALEHQPYASPWEKKPRPKSQIDVINIETGESKNVGSFDASLRCLSWFPNGEALLFMKERVGFLYNEPEDHEWINVVNIASGREQTLVKFDGLQQSLNPTISPDGRKVAFMFDADNPTFNFMPSIGLVPTGLIVNNLIPAITRLTSELKLFSPRWSNDGQQIFALRDHGAYKQIYSIDIKTGAPKQITNAPLNIEGYSLSPDGKQLAWIGQDAQGTRIIRMSSSDGHNVHDLAIIPSVPHDMALSEVREVEWKASDYPTPMRGLLFLPLNYQKGHRYPLIIDIHGGDSGSSLANTFVGGILTTTPLEWQMWNAKGYAVFVPEFRSSASFGALAITNAFKNHDRLGSDLKDIEAGVDALITNGYVDSNRLAIIGHSAGALRANWFCVATHRYRAIVSKEGWADEFIAALMNPPTKRGQIFYGGSPREVPQNYLKNSALYHSSGATTPTLFLMGNSKLGGADNHGTVNMLYNILKAQGVDVQYVTYPNEGHVFEQSSNKSDVLARTVQWIDEHMKIKKKH